MKKSAKKGLHPSQKRLIRRYILSYFLYVASQDNSSNKLKKPIEKPSKTPVVERNLEDWEELAPVLVEEAEPEEEVPKNNAPETREDHTHTTEGAGWRRHIVSYKHRLKVVAVFAFVVLFITVGLQLLYPKDRALPFSRLNSQGYLGFSSTKDILQSFEDFDSRTVTVHTHTKTLTTSYADLGVIVNPEQTVDQLTEYSVKDRLIPFSILFSGNKTYSVERDINQSQLDLYVKDVIALNSKKPSDAIVKLNGTKFNITPSEDGFEYQGEILRSQILRSNLEDKGQIVFAPTILYPNISSDVAQSVVNKIQARLDNPIMINAEGKTKTVGSKTMASWVFINHKPEDKNVEIGFDVNKVSASMQSLAEMVDKAAIPTIITYLNGNQVGRNVGKDGKLLQFDDLVERISNLQTPTIGTLEASVLTIPPKEVAERKYTKDSLGLQSLIEYWTANNTGEYAVDVRSINGLISANKNSFQLFPSVGVYRAYIASLVYAQINAGSVSAFTPTVTGQTVGTCISLMLRASDDRCTNALGSLVGWSASDNLLKSQGFTNTTLTQGAGLTTANDATNWMLKMLSSEISTIQHTGEITDHMINQSFKDGIAAGADGITVASRSGSFGRITNDIGIVYNPSGTYVVAILSEGSSSQLIENLAREINKVMNQ